MYSALCQELHTHCYMRQFSQQPVMLLLLLSPIYKGKTEAQFKKPLKYSFQLGSLRTGLYIQTCLMPEFTPLTIIPYCLSSKRNCISDQAVWKMAQRVRRPSFQTVSCTSALYKEGWRLRLSWYSVWKKAKSLKPQTIKRNGT